jgi:hypothetical protein
MEKTISTTPFPQEYLYSVRRIHKKPDEGGLIQSPFFITIKFYLKCCGSTARTWRFRLGDHHVIHADEHDCCL